MVVVTQMESKLRKRTGSRASMVEKKCVFFCQKMNAFATFFKRFFVFQAQFVSNFQFDFI